MCDEILLTIGEDGVAIEYDDTWDIVIHCESKEEHDATIKRLTGLESRWISCKERLPESFQEVLVCGDNGDMDIIIGFTVDGIDDRWIWQMSPKLLFVKEIVAWQPLPEKFKEEGGEE